MHTPFINFHTHRTSLSWRVCEEAVGNGTGSGGLCVEKQWGLGIDMLRSLWKEDQVLFHNLEKNGHGLENEGLSP